MKNKLHRIFVLLLFCVTATFVFADNEDNVSVTVEETEWDGEIIVTIPMERYLIGDVNGDGQVNTVDLVAIINYTIGRVEGINKNRADVNGNGEVDSEDISMVIDIILSPQE